jgi:riboflavin kinase/FMN adenylyltransferase
MRVWTDLDTLEPPRAGAAVAIGTFDGVHLGHRALIRAAVEDSRALGCESVVFTFDRHPAELVSPESAPAYLASPRQQERLISELGADHLVVARFDAAMRDLPAEAFVDQVLVARLRAKSVHVGQGFRFGSERRGDESLLRRAGRARGFRVRPLAPVEADGGPVSSTRIRQLLGEGDVVAAARLLGRPFELDGVVVSGDRRGRLLGFPTANLAPAGRRVVPADGVYAVRVRLGPSLPEPGRPVLRGACSIGVRPTLGGTQRTIETYLFDFDGDLYGQELELAFVARLREERRFPTLDALTDQMRLDVQEARRILSE